MSDRAHLDPSREGRAPGAASAGASTGPRSPDGASTGPRSPDGASTGARSPDGASSATAGTPPWFEVTEPARGETPLLVEVPHAGLMLDPEALAWTLAPARSIAADADLYVDEIVREAPAVGATLLVAHASRYLVDLNRGPDDFDAEAVDGGGQPVPPRRRLAPDHRRRPGAGGAALAQELERRMAMVYRPYHATLERILARKRARFGCAVLLCAHSMPSATRPRAGWPPAPPVARADIVPGTRGRTTAAGNLIDVVERVAGRHGLSVRHDDPYRGGFSTAHYGKPGNSIHAIQVEIARRLYMDEASLQRRPPALGTVREFAGILMNELGAATSCLVGRPGEASAEPT
ncbi:MAG: N-formylglutamate amidohydrolase [Polyangiaceae bacterium]